MELNFVFLGRKVYIGTSTEQKTKTSKWLELDVLAIFYILVVWF